MKRSLKEYFLKNKNLQKSLLKEDVLKKNSVVFLKKNCFLDIEGLDIFKKENTIFFVVKKNVKIKDPIKIVFLEKILKIKFLLEENSKINLIFKNLNEKEMEFHLKKGAFLKKTIFSNQDLTNQDLINQKLSIKSKLENSSKIESFIFFKKGNINYESFLEKKTFFSMKAFAFLKKGENFFDLKIVHKDKQSKSFQLLKSVVEKAKLHFKAFIKIEKNSEKSDAFLLNKNLLLEKKSQVISKPFLDILSEDVKASHGSNMFQIEKEEIFFLKMRGFNKKKIKDLLIRGFLKEINFINKKI